MSNLKLKAEQTAFDEMRETLCEEHEGEYVLFRDGRVLGFFTTAEEAYGEGLSQFGLDETFLIDQVRGHASLDVTSVSWDFGLINVTQ